MGVARIGWLVVAVVVVAGSAFVLLAAVRALVDQVTFGGILRLVVEMIAAAVLTIAVWRRARAALSSGPESARSGRSAADRTAARRERERRW